MAPHDYCREKAAPAGSGLYYSLLFLDRPRQLAITAVHAFHREVGDVVRNCTDIEPARARLAWWRTEIGALFGRHPGHPVTRAIAEALPSFPIAQERLLDVVDGHEMDLERRRYNDFEPLQLYCRRISSTISLVTSDILGYRHPGTTKFADQMGLAAQLSDIIRNVGLDARQGRIYLPQNELRQFGVAEEDILNARQSDNIKALLAFQAQRVDSLHASALSQLPGEDRKAQRAALALAAIRRALLDEIRRDGYRVLDRGLSLTPLRQLLITARVWLRH